MLRRYIIDQPTSRLAVWARRMALFSLAVAIITAIMVSFDLPEEVRPRLATFAAALIVAVFALMLAFAAFVVIWKDGLAGMGYALAAIGISLALIAYPAYLGVKAYKLPWIYDITTDPIDPPRYEALARIRPRDANPIIYAGLATAEQQAAAYSDIEPLEEDATPQDSFRAALAIVGKRRWRVVEARPPQAGRDGRIEAFRRSWIIGIRNDIAIRVRADQSGSRIDVRSSFRYGPHDFGTNASLIRALIDDIDDAIGNQKPERPATPPPKAKKAPPKGNQPSAKR
ncbi:MAG: hypothetical protein QOC56_822 [Alphaproteobacteria bacterium]|nr:hypothetical protein [Alphaproteobacteria bacterium]